MLIHGPRGVRLMKISPGYRVVTKVKSPPNSSGSTQEKLLSQNPNVKARSSYLSDLGGTSNVTKCRSKEKETRCVGSKAKLRLKV